MAEKIIFEYNNMNVTADKIATLSGDYATAGKNFITGMNEAIANWEGDSKNTFSAFINGDVNTYITQTIPNVIQGLSEMLASNAKQMENADSEIAKELPTTLY